MIINILLLTACKRNPPTVRLHAKRYRSLVERPTKSVNLNCKKENMIIRKNSFWMLALSSIMLLSFASNNRNYQSECVTIETDGYVTIKIWDTKKGAKYKPEQARKDAIHAILFSGIAGSSGCATQPPLLNKTEEQENFKTIEKSFLAKKGKWAMFTRSSATETTLPTSIGDKQWKVYQVSISKNDLRKYLEEQKIIKSLTNGF